MDLRIARGLDYYTGTVYETTLNDLPGVGSVCSGGRYDDLASHYTNTKLTGVGISIGLSRLFYKLREAGVIKASKQSLAEVVVLPLAQEQMAIALEAASLLRTGGVATLLYTEPSNLKKKMKYVDRMGARYAVIVGDQEQADGLLSVKDMQTGASLRVLLSELSTTVASSR